MTATNPVRKSGITVKDIGGEILLHSSDDKAIHVLNPTAQLIWELCDGEHTPADMASVIEVRFAVQEGHDVLGDVQQTLETFSTKGLLQH